MKIELTIPGKPIAKKRPRFFRRGKGVDAYNDQETEEGKWLCLAKKKLPEKPLNNPLRIVLVFGMPIPQTSKKKHAAMAERKIKHTKKPDIDNLIKFALDCLNGIAWEDDKQIVSLEAVKQYVENPATIIGIQPLDDEMDEKARK